MTIEAAPRLGQRVAKKQSEIAEKADVFVCEKANQNGWHPYE
jgi:hypothetical protein